MTQSLTRRKLISLFAAIVLAFSMTVIAPASAFASATAVNAYSTDTVQTTMQGTVYMENEFYATDLDSTTQHIDYTITSFTRTDGGTSAPASVNKHSGVLTPSAEGTVVVTASLVNHPQPTGMSENPCYSVTDPDSIISTATKTVQISGTGTYGYQGNNLQVLMTSFSPAFVSLTNAGYNNTLTGVTASGGVVSFNFTQNYGIGNRTIAAYQTMNAGNITLTDASGTVATLDDGIDLAQQGSSKQNLIAEIDADYFDSGTTYTLTFTSSYVGGNSQLLSIPVSFTFTF